MRKLILVQLEVTAFIDDPAEVDALRRHFQKQLDCPCDACTYATPSDPCPNYDLRGIQTTVLVSYPE